MSKKSHHFLTLWPWPLTYDLEKLVRSGHYHYQCVYQIWEQSIPWFLSYRVNTIAGGGQLRRKTITSPDPSDTGDITRTPAFWDTPRGPMITHTSDSHQIPSQNKTKSKLQILKNCQKSKFWDFATNFTHEIYKYEMDPTRTVGATERTRDVGRTSTVKLTASS